MVVLVHSLFIAINIYKRVKQYLCANEVVWKFVKKKKKKPLERYIIKVKCDLSHLFTLKCYQIYAFYEIIIIICLLSPRTR